MSVPCGRCAACLRNKQQDWLVRLKHEERYSNNAYFVTLTYNDQNLPLDGNGLAQLYKPDVQKFIKRLRKNTKVKFKYFCVGEYGETYGRPHYHLLIFNLGKDRNQVEKEIIKAWSKRSKIVKGERQMFGQIDIGDVTDASIAYCTKYIIQKRKVPEFMEQPFSLMSTKPAIGSDYLKKVQNTDWHEIDNKFYIQFGASKFKMPEYYRNKLFTEADREQYAALIESECTNRPKNNLSHQIEAKKRKLAIKNKKSKF
ncbi:replication initiator protein [Microviridae sp.]|nr:replication initiator protein [Microviridae sp.]